MINKEFQILVVIGEELNSHIPQLAQLRIEIFKEFPYLYEGTLEYEAKYLKTYSSSKNSMAVLIFHHDVVIGASTGVILSDETSEIKKPFIEQNFIPEKIFYCGESVLKKEYRGYGFYKEFFKRREEFARSLAGVEKICFCGVVRSENHPLRPNNYQPLDKVWQHYGYKLLDGVISYFNWREIGDNQESSHPMQYWIKDLY